jgi:hypothetical protein
MIKIKDKIMREGRDLLGLWSFPDEESPASTPWREGKMMPKTH